jgi:biotin-(acetyl-CoA carboxylase) ligase
VVTIGCGINKKIKELQINTTATKQHKNKMNKSKANTFFQNTVEITQKSLTLSIHILYIFHTTNSSKMLLHIL